MFRLKNAKSLLEILTILDLSRCLIFFQCFFFAARQRLAASYRAGLAASYRAGSHGRALSRRPGSRPHLLALLRDLLQGYKCVTHVMDKRFMLVLKFCDYAVEPWYYERGADFYADGQNYAMGSLLTILGPTMLGAAPFEAMLAAFQQAMRAKTPDSLDALVAAARPSDSGI